MASSEDDYSGGGDVDLNTKHNKSTFQFLVLKKFRLEVTVDNCQSSTDQVSLDFAQILSM